MSATSDNQVLILNYWKSWQTSDWELMRSCLASQVDFGGFVQEADQFIEFCKQGNPWKDVQLLASSFNEEGGAILYEGTDTVTSKIIRVGEFITVKENKVIASIAAFGSGQPPQ